MTKRYQDYLSYGPLTFQHAQVAVTSLFVALLGRGPATAGLTFWANALHAKPLALKMFGVIGPGPANAAESEQGAFELNQFVQDFVNAAPSGDVAYINSTDPAVRKAAAGALYGRVEGITGATYIDLGPFTGASESPVGTNISTMVSMRINTANTIPTSNQQHVNQISFALLKHEAGSNSTLAQQSTITADDATLANAIANYL